MIKLENKTHKQLYVIFVVGIIACSLLSTINIELIYHYQQPLFIISFQSFLSSLLIPGGFIGYIATFISSLYFYPVLGSIILSLIIITPPLITYNSLIKTYNHLISTVLSSIIGILSFLLFTSYSFKPGNFLILIAAMLLTNLNFVLLKKYHNHLINASLLFILSVVFYMLLGGFGLLFSSVLLSIRIGFLNWNASKKSIAIALILLLAVILPYVSIKYIFQLIPLQQGYFSDFINSDTYKNPVYIYFLIAAILLLEFIGLINVKKESKSRLRNYLMAYFIFVVLLILLPFKLIDQNEKKKHLIEFYAYNKEWGKLIKVMDEKALNDYTLVFQANRALYFTGNYLDNACKIPQKFGTHSLLIEHNVNKSILMPTSDIYYDLGLINEARHWAHEAYTSFGNQPRILKRLVEVNIISQKYNTAKKYILLLKKSLTHRNWALEQEKLLFNETLISTHNEYSTKRNQLAQTDFFANSHVPAENLFNLTNQPGYHKMAFDYLILYYLLRHEIVYVINNTHQFKEYGYKTLPRLVQEGIVLLMAKTQNKTINLNGYQIDAGNFERFKDYSKLYALYKNNDKKAKEILDKKFGDSYWYYIHFYSPITRTGKK